MDFTEAMENIGKAVDALGVIVVIIGGGFALLSFLRNLTRPEVPHAYSTLRRSLGRSILLGLEVLVAGDIIRTVATTPTFESVGVLGLIVLIRTFLSFSLEVEMEGRWPWSQSPATSTADASAGPPSPLPQE